MTDTGPTDRDSVPLELARLIDARCDRFEAAWGTDPRPRIEEELAGVDGPARPDLLRELIALEVGLRRAAGESPAPEEYRRRFPDDVTCVESAFAGTLAGPASPPSPGTPPATDAMGGGDAGPPRAGNLDVLSRYRIIRHHASGGLGQVSVALDRELNREVALKEIQLRYADDPSSRARFLLEAEVTGVLEHPGVVPIYSLGRYGNGRPFYAMRLIRGESLKQAIRRYHEDGPTDPGARDLALRQLLRRFLDLCNIVAYAHSRGVLHRDVKPANVMLGPYGETLLVDWGLAKVVGRDVDPVAEPGSLSSVFGATIETRPDSTIGTPGYMSPEQGAGRTDLVGPASDVYGLGATLYHILTGQPPREWAGGPGTPASTTPPPRTLVPRISRALEAVCLKALAPRPEDRYADAGGLAADVERWLADEPVSARREPAIVRARRWLRRNRTVAASALVALVVGSAALAVLAARERASNDQLRRERDRADARFMTAAEAIEAFRTAVDTTVDVRNRPDLRPIRRALLAQPYQYFRRLRDDLESDPDPRPEHQERLAKAYQSLADLTREVDTLDNALVAYRGALAVRERLARSRSDDVRARDALAGAHLNVANVLSSLRRPDEARAAFEKALTIRRALADEHPDDLTILRGLARASNNYANLLGDLGRHEESLGAHEAALRARLRVAQALPDDLPARGDLANSHYNLGNLLDEMRIRAGDGPAGRTLAARAGASYGAAIGLLERMARDAPGTAVHRFELARACNNLGLLQLDTGHLDDALASFTRSLGLKEQLSREHPTVLVYQSDLARTYDNLGIVLRETGRIAEATDRCTQALRLRQALVDANPEVDAFRVDLAGSFVAVAELHRRAGRSDEALPLARRAVEIRRSQLNKAPGIVRSRRAFAEASLLLCATLRDAGLPAEAASAVRQRLELLGEDPIEHYNAACDLALCISAPGVDGAAPTAEQRVERGRFAEEAVDSLRTAVALGFGQPDQIEALKRDEDLRPIWDHARFRELINELLPPSDPFLQDLTFPGDPFAPVDPTSASG